MEVRTGYKQTEAGVIPEDWNAVFLRDFIALQRGHDLTWRDRKDGDVPVMGSAGQNGFHNIAISKGPGVVLGRSGASFGQAHYCEQDFWPHNTALYVTDFRGNDPLFVFYFLRSLDFSRHNSGGAQQSLNRNFIARIKVGVPPPPEQLVIAEALRDVDRLLGGLDRLIAKKRDLKQAAMEQILNGHTRFPRFHSKWETRRLEDVIHLIPSGVYGEEKPRPGLIAASVATTAHINEDDTWNNREMPVRYFTAQKLIDYATAEGDLIVVKSSGSAASIQSGKIGFIDSKRAEKFVFSNFLMLLRPTNVFPRFLYFYLCSYNIKKLLPTLVEASTYPNIRLGDYLALEIPLPSTAEQTAIAEVLTEMDAELAALEQRREKSRVLKQAMMQELLTGRTRLISPKEAHA